MIDSGGRRGARPARAGASGWPGAGMGRAAHVERGSQYLASSAQLAGLFPFIQAAGLPSTGVPIGRDLLSGELVCLDPPGWVGRLTSNPGVYVQAQPGVGKSALTKRLCVGLSSYGFQVVCPGDVKGEYSDTVLGLGGQVVKFGRGLNRINPLDSGVLGRALPRLPRAAREGLEVEVNARRTETLYALLATQHALDRRPTASERSAVQKAVQLLADSRAGGEDPTLPHVVRVLRDPPAPLLAALALDDVREYRALFREVTDGLANLCEGPLAGLFDGPSSTPVVLASPGISVDLSALLSSGPGVVAAGMIATWAYTYSALDAAAALGLHDRPPVIPLDELWRALRSGAGMVDSFDSLTRLNRLRGAVTILVTHSQRDLAALPTEEDRAKAAGLMERCDTVILGASTRGELEDVSARKPLTSEEIALVSSWATPIGTAVDGTDQPHPGRGKYLVKLGARLGVPVKLALTARERELYDTDRAMRRAHATPPLLSAAPDPTAADAQLADAASVAAAAVLMPPQQDGVYGGLDAEDLAVVTDGPASGAGDPG